MSFPEISLRRVAKVVNGGTPTSEEENWGGEVPWATPIDLGIHHGAEIRATMRTLTESGAQAGSCVVPGESVLLSTRAPIGYAATTKVPMAFNQGCKALVPSSGLEASFLLYALINSKTELQSLGQGSTFTELSGSSLSAFRIPLPPPLQQKQIVDYLDTQTAKIELLIEKQEQLIETLVERRQAVISHAVTKGLNPNAPMKDSGIEWLGQIPSTWPVVKAGYVYSVTVGKMLNAAKVSSGGEVVPYLRAANIQPEGLDLREVKSMAVSMGEMRTLRLRRNDVVVVEGGGGYGRSDVLRKDLKGWVFQNHVLRVRPRNDGSSDFFNYLMKTINANGHVASLSNHATIPSISSEKLASVRFGLPSVTEQAAIVAHLDRETAQIDALSAKAREMIDVLKERRQALISAAVTGKTDVRRLV